MAAELPAAGYETATAELREKTRVDRRKMLASLPRGKISQDYLAGSAEQLVNSREELEDVLITVGAMPDTVAAKGRLQQSLRKALENLVTQSSRAMVASTDGMDAAQQLLSPEPEIADLNGEQAKILKVMKTNYKCLYLFSFRDIYS